MRLMVHRSESMDHLPHVHGTEGLGRSDHPPLRSRRERPSPKVLRYRTFGSLTLRYIGTVIKTEDFKSFLKKYITGFGTEDTIFWVLTSVDNPQEVRNHALIDAEDISRTDTIEFISFFRTQLQHDRWIVSDNCKNYHRFHYNSCTIHRFQYDGFTIHRFHYNSFTIHRFHYNSFTIHRFHYDSFTIHDINRFNYQFTNFSESCGLNNALSNKDNDDVCKFNITIVFFHLGLLLSCLLPTRRRVRIVGGCLLRENSCSACSSIDIKSFEDDLQNPDIPVYEIMENLNNVVTPLHLLPGDIFILIQFGSQALEQQHNELLSLDVNESSFRTWMFTMEAVCMTNSVLKDPSLWKLTPLDNRVEHLNVSLQTLEDTGYLQLKHTIKKPGHRFPFNCTNVYMETTTLTDLIAENNSKIRFEFEESKMELDIRSIATGNGRIVDLAFTGYRTLQNVLEIDVKEQELGGIHVKAINSKIIGGSFRPSERAKGEAIWDNDGSSRKSMSNYPSPRYTLQHEIPLKEDSRVVCAQWDATMAAWSTDNCEIVSGNDVFSVCECRSDDSVPKLRSDRTTIHTHLCMSLLVAQISLMVSMLLGEDGSSEFACKVMAAVVHYSYLVAFSWMLIEGIHLYYLVIKVFSADRSRVRLYGIIAYTWPLLVVLSTATATKLNAYNSGGRSMCWLKTNGLVWTFTGFVLLIIVNDQDFRNFPPDLAQLFSHDARNFQSQMSETQQSDDVSSNQVGSELPWLPKPRRYESFLPKMRPQSGQEMVAPTDRKSTVHRQVQPSREESNNEIFPKEFREEDLSQVIKVFHNAENPFGLLPISQPLAGFQLIKTEPHREPSNDLQETTFEATALQLAPQPLSRLPAYKPSTQVKPPEIRYVGKSKFVKRPAKSPPETVKTFPGAPTSKEFNISPSHSVIKPSPVMLLTIVPMMFQINNTLPHHTLAIDSSIFNFLENLKPDRKCGLKKLEQQQNQNQITSAASRQLKAQLNKQEEVTEPDHSYRESLGDIVEGSLGKIPWYIPLIFSSLVVLSWITSSFVYFWILVILYIFKNNYYARVRYRKRYYHK
ncbi:unnamed protein product [Cyprideis torosa]|uniref:G-protein coupled receptors family 2 profile 2 domain-containing protein n=1 Tax=Cyprideis torosa TaxID=163714 RepID=A0A7R8W8D9_9CRUS|nr:unnamed protein product [Cyprideis torosa]CAG0884203.1 unnamed protein product [Cyprideis torosa]